VSFSILEKLREFFSKEEVAIVHLSEQEFVSDYHHYGLAERYLHLSIECLLDIGFIF